MARTFVVGDEIINTESIADLWASQFNFNQARRITNTKHVHRRIRSDDWAASSPGAKAPFTVLLDPLRWMSEVPFRQV